MDKVRTMSDKLKDAVAEIKAEHPEHVCLFAAPLFEGEGGHIYCKLYNANEHGAPLGEPLKVVQVA